MTYVFQALRCESLQIVNAFVNRLYFLLFFLRILTARTRKISIPKRHFCLERKLCLTSISQLTILTYSYLTKLGLLKNFVTTMNKNDAGIHYLKGKFAHVNDTKIKQDFL